MSKKGEYLAEVLNRAEAMLDCSAGSISELAEALLPEQPKAQAVSRVAEWIRSRQRNPNGETALRLQAWVAAKTLEIDAAGRKAAAAYRAAFKVVKGRRAAA